jgi:hypothetical protein
MGLSQENVFENLGKFQASALIDAGMANRRPRALVIIAAIIVGLLVIFFLLPLFLFYTKPATPPTAPSQQSTPSPNATAAPSPTPLQPREGFLYLTKALTISDETGIRNFKPGAEIRITSREGNEIVGTIDGQPVRVPGSNTSELPLNP